MSTIAIGMLLMAMSAVLVTFLASALIVLTERWHGNFSLDSDTKGTQKFHKRPVPRIGGLAMLFGIMAAVIYNLNMASSENEAKDASFIFKLMVAALPALVMGLLEDLTKKVSISSRLLATFASALLSCWMLGITLTRVDVLGVDLLLQIIPVAMMFTAFAVAGVANSVNIIDGFNGLAGSTTIIILSALCFLAWNSGDALSAKLAVIGISIALGFLFLNYPTGRLFMGDGGAYLLGFWIAEIAVLIIIRNPEINAWQVLSICSYPIIEVVFSMYRRKVVRKLSVGQPDRLHLHSLVYRRLVSRLVQKNECHPWIRNAAVSCILITYVVPTILLSVTVGVTVMGALLVLAIQVFSYMAFYSRLVRGRWCFNPAVILGLRKEAKVTQQIVR